MYQNYIFDLYGTLVDIHTNEESMEFWKAMSLLFGYYGATYEKMELKSAYRKEMAKYNGGTIELSMEAIFTELFKEKGVTVSEEGMGQLIKSFRAFSTAYIKLYPGVIDFLNTLKQNGKRVYLLSNAQASMTRPELQMLGLTAYFDGIAISSEVGYKKPDKKFFKALLDQFQIDKDSSIMIGNDYEADIKGGHLAGLDTCYIYSNLSPKEDKNRVNRDFATYYFQTLNYKEVENKLLIKKSKE